jgi:hypothetical protein
VSVPGTTHHHSQSALDLLSQQMAHVGVWHRRHLATTQAAARVGYFFTMVGV